MKRPLTKEEEEMCKIGLKGRAERIKFLKEEINYFEEFNAFNKKWKKYREEKEKKDKLQRETALIEALKMLKESLKEEERLTLIEQDQLKNGVVVKKVEAPVGVN